MSFVNRFFATILFLFLGTAAHAGFVEYEATTFPETEGWERVGSGTVSRSLQDSIFTQFSYLPGILDAYQRSLQDLEPTLPIFIDWRVQTDVPSSVLDTSSTPVVVSAFGTGPNYHFTITEDRVRIIRSNFLPIFYIDIEPGVFHTYRLELDGSDFYAWSIDGQTIDSGIPQGSFLNNDPMLIWGVRGEEFNYTTQWDYIRYGTIPEPCTGLLILPGILLCHSRRKAAPLFS